MSSTKKCLENPKSLWKTFQNTLLATKDNRGAIMLHVSDDERTANHSCEPSSLEEFPHLETEMEGRYELACMATIICIYAFLGLAIACDEYFVPSVERLCYRLGLSYDIGGATLMAFTTSSPEFFVNCVSTFVSIDGDIGIGTIVGSSVFNTLVIVSLCAVFATKPIQLDWWPISRDLSWYFLATILLTPLLVDFIVTWYEALLLIVIFVFNLTALFNDRRLQRFFRNEEKRCILPCFVPISDDIPDKIDSMPTDPAEDDPELPFNFFEYAYLESTYDRFVWLTVWPLHALFFVSIPNCRRSRFKNCLWCSIIFSTLWISLFSYLIAWMVTVIGYMIGVPDAILGMTLVAAGTSIPEAVTSYTVTRKGYGSMAICNAISSNTFNILFCLAVPWFLKAAWIATDVTFGSEATGVSTVTMLVTGVAMYIAFLARRFELNRTVGLICFIVYLLFLLFECLMEFNVFGNVHKETCPLH